MATVAELILVISGRDQTGRMLAGIKRDLNSFGSNAAKAGTALTAGLTLPIAGIGAAAFTAARDFESAFAGVRKTVDASEAEFAVLRQGIRDMAKEIPASATSIAGVAEAAGQLGIQKQNILAFTRVMIDLGETTNLGATEAATALARLANITQMPQTEFDRLGSSIVALGNNLATTEAESVEMALRIAGAGKQIGLTEAQILGVAGALSSVGIEAEAGGSAISKVLIKIASSVKSGSDELALFAKVAGLSVEEFKRKFETDAAGALTLFVEGLRRVSDAGGNLYEVLDGLELSEVRTRDALLRLAGGGDVLRRSLDLSTNAWKENTALTEEARKRYETAAAKWQIFKNKLHDVAITIGDALLPIFTSLIERAEPLVAMIDGAAQAFAGLDANTKKWIVIGAAAAAALGPLIIMLGAVASGVAALLPLISFLASSFLPLAAAGVVIYVLIRHWDDLTRAVTGATRIISAAVSGLVSVFSAALNGVLRVVTTIARAIYTALQWLNPFAPHSPPLVDQVRDGVDEIAANFRRLQEVEASLGVAEQAVRDFEGAMSGLAASVRASALQQTISDINRAAGSEAAAAYRQASSALEELRRDYEALGSAIVASAQKFDPAIQSVEDLRGKIAGLKNAINDLSRTPLLEEKPFDEKSKKLKRQMDELELRIVKLKQKGPLTMEVRTPTAGGGVKTETRDTAVGAEVKRLEAQLEQLRLQAEQVDIEKRLAIDPLKDKLQELTEEAPKPFAEIIAGITAAKNALQDLAPLEGQIAMYDQLGERIGAQERILQGYADMAAEVVRQQEAMATAAANAAGSIDEIVASLEGLGETNPAIAEMDQRMADVSASIEDMNTKAEEFKVRIEGMIQRFQEFKARVEEVIGPLDRLKWLLLGAAAGFVAIQTAALAMQVAIGIVRGLTAAVIVFNAVMALNPVVLLAAAIVALIAVLIILEVKFGLVSKAVGVLKDGFEKVLKFARENWPEIATLISGPFAPLVLLATDAFGIKSKLLGAFGEMKDKIGRGIGDIVQWFKDLPGRILSGLGNLGSFLFNKGKDLIQGFINGMKSLPIPNPLDLVPGSGIVKGAISGGKKLIGKAVGGPVTAGYPYIVGERGPELFVPGASGTIIPNRELAAVSPGGVNITMTGPITVVNNERRRDAKATLADVAFALAAEMRSRGRMVTA